MCILCSSGLKDYYCPVCSESIGCTDCCDGTCVNCGEIVGVQDLCLE